MISSYIHSTTVVGALYKAHVLLHGVPGCSQKTFNKPISLQDAKQAAAIHVGPHMHRDIVDQAACAAVCGWLA